MTGNKLVDCVSICVFGIAALLLGSPAMCEQAPPPPTPRPLSLGMNVLVIGDSNTEIGHITGGLARLLERDYGYFGSGYHSLNKTIGMGQGYLPYVRIENVGNWESYTMLWPTAAPKPYIAPEGTCVRSSAPGAHTDVTFYGTGADLYWLSEPGGGAFDIYVDDVHKANVPTSGKVLKVNRTRLVGLSPGWHKLEARVQTGKVTLEGVDARFDAPGLAHRAVVHKWGKGWAATNDFLDVDEGVFSSALRLIDPDVVVVLLGTNDHNLRGANRDQFADNISAIISRVRRAVPKARILLVSAFQINGTWTNLALESYLEVFPEIARSNRAYYWDMSSFFGHFEAAKANGWFLEDGIHASQKGGARIAEQLAKEVSHVAASDRFACPPSVEEKLREVGVPVAGDAEPPNIQGLASWWAADGPVTIDEKHQVASLKDMSGHKADAVARWKECRPTFVETAANGRPVIHLNATKKQCLRFPLDEKARTFIIVLRGKGILFGHPYFNTRPFHPGVTDPRKMLDKTYASPGLTEGKAHVDGVSVPPCNIEFSDERFRVISLVASQPVGVGYLGWGGSWNCDHYFSGDIAEVLMYDRVLLDSERASVERYLLRKYRLVSLHAIGVEEGSNTDAEHALTRG